MALGTTHGLSPEHCSHRYQALVNGARLFHNWLNCFTVIKLGAVELCALVDRVTIDRAEQGFAILTGKVQSGYGPKHHQIGPEVDHFPHSSTPSILINTLYAVDKKLKRKLYDDVTTLSALLVLC